MCGIAGILNSTTDGAGPLVDRMLESIVHRGPDDRGLEIIRRGQQGSVTLGQVRLSILDLSTRGHQPMWSGDRQSAITYNGEVYNFRDLRKELQDCGITFQTGTDTEVVLEALQYWGPEVATPRFNGMFAFAFYDKRNDELWLARDRLGIKPLYVRMHNDAIAFASEPKALLQLNPSKPDTHNVLTQLLYERLDGPDTPFDGIESVLPGTLTAYGSRPKQITYFDCVRDLNPDRIVRAGRDSFSEHYKRFRTLFETSVEQHLISDAPLAAMCSGGLDSSLITAVSKRHVPDIVGYVVDVEGVSVSEAQRARLVADHLQIELREIRLTADDFLSMWPEAVAAYDRPNYVPQNVGVMAVAKAMASDGFKVALAGDGADELLGGYRWHAEVYRTFRRKRLRASLIPDWWVMHRLGRYFPPMKPLDRSRLRDYPFDDVRASANLGGAQSTLFDGMKRQLRQRELFAKLGDVKPLEDRAFIARSLEDIYMHMAEGLRAKDRMTMWQSLECRVPFIENDLIDFSIHLPRSSKYAGGLKKRLVSELAKEMLPRSVAQASKIGFNIPSRLWMNRVGMLRNSRLADLLKWRRQDQDTIIQEISRNSNATFRMLSTELWLRYFFDNESLDSLRNRILMAGDPARS